MNPKLCTQGTIRDTPWLPIDTMPLSAITSTVDIRDQDRLYIRQDVAGIEYTRYVEREDLFDSLNPQVYIGGINVFQITTTTGSINLTTDAEWRPHV